MKCLNGSLSSHNRPRSPIDPLQSMGDENWGPLTWLEKPPTSSIQWYVLIWTAVNLHYEPSLRTIVSQMIFWFNWNHSLNQPHTFTDPPRDTPLLRVHWQAGSHYSWKCRGFQHQGWAKFRAITLGPLNTPAARFVLYQQQGLLVLGCPYGQPSWLVRVNWWLTKVSYCHHWNVSSKCSQSRKPLPHKLCEPWPQVLCLSNDW